jgi:hypothetical protein
MVYSSYFNYHNHDYNFFAKTVPLSLSIMYFIVGIFMGVLFDHTSSIEPFDYYDVNDSSRYEFFDFMSYIMYGPFTYLIIYFITS